MTESRKREEREYKMEWDIDNSSKRNSLTNENIRIVV